jgi:hypothetical protein
MKYLIGISLAALLFISCEDLSFDEKSTQIPDTLYIFDNFSTKIEWNDSKGSVTMEDQSNLSFVTVRNDSLIIRPQENDFGTFNIIVKISDKKNSDILEKTIHVLKGKGSLHFGWTLGLSGTVKYMVAKISKGNMVYRDTVNVACKSSASHTFANIEAGIWSYEVSYSQQCNAPCTPQCPVPATKTGTAKVVNGKTSYYNNYTFQGY